MDSIEGTEQEPETTPRHNGRRFRGERGANLVEYCLLVVLIMLACLAGVTQFGKAVPSDSFVSVSGAI